MTDDMIPDVPPPITPVTTAPVPAISSPNSFFFYMILILLFLLHSRLAWECVLLMGSTQSPATLQMLKWLWLLPIAGILGSIIVPSVGTTTVWLTGASWFNSIPIFLAIAYVLLFGNPRLQA